MTSQPERKGHKTPIILALLTVVVILVVGAILGITNGSSIPTTTTSSTITTTSSYVSIPAVSVYFTCSYQVSQCVYPNPASYYFVCTGFCLQTENMNVSTSNGFLNITIPFTNGSICGIGYDCNSLDINVTQVTNTNGLQYSSPALPEVLPPGQDTIHLNFVLPQYFNASVRINVTLA